MKVLVTGATGFVGRHLLKELTLHGHQPIAAVQPGTSDTLSTLGQAGLECFAYDATDRRAVIEHLCALKPAAIIHLAGIAHVVDAAKDISRLVAVNAHSVQNLCDAVNQYSQEPVPVILASTALVYGAGTSAVNESSPLAPLGAYAKSKAAAEYILSTYAGTQVKPYIVRPFNHTGPGQSPDFVCPGLARKVATSVDGTVQVGNLAAWRDLSDVRDIVRAYRLLVEKRPDASCYVLGSGKLVKIADVLEMIIKISGKKVSPVVATSLLRTADHAAIYADYQQATRDLGWRPQYDLLDTLRDLYHSIVA